MELYIILGAAIFAVSAVVAFVTKAVSNNHVFAHLFLFPCVFLVSRLPLAEFPTHLMMAGVMFIVGFIAFYLKWFEGGAARALILLGLWAPSWAFLGEGLMYGFIAVGAGGLIVMLLKLSDKVEFAAIVFASFCGLFAYQYSELPSQPPMQIEDAHIKSNSTVALRGLSETVQQP